MIKVRYLDTFYYYSVQIDRFYDNNFKRVTKLLTTKLLRLPFENTIKEETQSPEQLVKSYLRTYEKQILSDLEIKKICAVKRSRHDNEKEYLIKLATRNNLSWAIFPLELTCTKIKELRNLLNKNKLQYKEEPKGTFKIEAPLYLIDREKLMENIDHLCPNLLFKS